MCQVILRVREGIRRKVTIVDFDVPFRPQLPAIRAAARDGFRFRCPHVRDAPVLQGFRVVHGMLDLFFAYAPDGSVAARYRVADLENTGPPALWRRSGPVDQVVPALLALPVHGARGSPAVLEFRRSRDSSGATPDSPEVGREAHTCANSDSRRSWPRIPQQHRAEPGGAR